MPNSIMIYDDACPMCQGYTRAFKQLGWSDRKAFSKLPTDLLAKLDLDRARHEIPLLDQETGTVKYGLDSQIAVLSQGMPLLKPLLRRQWLKIILKPVYNLITYNRRVIAGTRPPASGFDCAPDFHLAWRMTYLGLAALIVIALGTLPATAGAVIVVVTILSAFKGKEWSTPAGNGFTVALVGSILACCLPHTLVAMVVGAELLRRFWPA